MSRRQNPSEFLKQIIGKPVVVKLNSGVDYRGVCDFYYSLKFFTLFITSLHWFRKYWILDFLLEKLLNLQEYLSGIYFKVHNKKYVPNVWHWSYSIDLVMNKAGRKITFVYRCNQPLYQVSTKNIAIISRYFIMLRWFHEYSTRANGRIFEWTVEKQIWRCIYSRK